MKAQNNPAIDKRKKNLSLFALTVEEIRFLLIQCLEDEICEKQREQIRRRLRRHENGAGFPLISWLHLSDSKTSKILHLLSGEKMPKYWELVSQRTDFLIHGIVNRYSLTETQKTLLTEIVTRRYRYRKHSLNLYDGVFGMATAAEKYEHDIHYQRATGSYSLRILEKIKKNVCADNRTFPLNFILHPKLSDLILSLQMLELIDEVSLNKFISKE